jgi:hypothetical protein
MVGVGGTRPKTKGQLIVWWIVFSLIMGFVAYVIIRNLVLR